MLQLILAMAYAARTMSPDWMSGPVLTLSESAAPLHFGHRWYAVKRPKDSSIIDLLPALIRLVHGQAAADMYAEG